ncbi:MAG: AsmA-like C-terminal region-containing protein [Ferruginibacter sp.]
MKKIFKIITKTLFILVGVLLIIYIGVFAYVSINKKSIIRQVTTELEKKMNGKVSIGDVELSFFRNFPKVAVLMNNISIKDTMFAKHNHPFFEAKLLYARLSIVQLVRKQSPLNGLTIEKGGFYFYTDSLGYTNTYLLQQKKDSSATKTGPAENDLKTVILRDMSFVIDDKSKEKLHNYYIKDLVVKFKNKDNFSLLLDLDADILIHSMAFNLPRGGFLKEQKFTGKFDVLFNHQLNQLQFDSINIKLSGQPFNLTGRFDLKKDSAQFSLRAHTRNLRYDDGKSMVPERIARSLSLVALSNRLDVDVSIDGPLKGGEPLIYINWAAKKTGLKTPFLDFENASFTGYFTNQHLKTLPRVDANSIIHISDFSANWHELPVKSNNIEILDLEKPQLTSDIVSDFPLTKLNELIGSSFLQLQSGEGSVNLSYKGPIEKNNNTNSFINGTVSFKNGAILYAPRGVVMKDLSGELLFKNSDVLINNLRCMVLDNKILMQGTARNLLTLMNTEPGKATIDWSVSTPSLNLGAFTFLLKPGKKVVAKNKNTASLASTAAKIDEVLEKAVLHVNLAAAALTYKKFTAANFNADVVLLANKYIINNAGMQHAGGSIRMNGSLENIDRNLLKAKLNAAVNNVDVSKLLYAFDNFGQDAIVSQNLEGKMTATVDASLNVDEDAKVSPSSVVSVVDFSLKNGALIKYEPVAKLQSFLFKNRDFENIRFAELKDRLEIANGDIKINRMEIQSTALSFFVEGVYSVRGNTDISIQVPLNNLKKRGPDYNPENIGTDKKVGRSIFVRGRPGSDGNISFKLDLFNRFKKDNAE